MTMRRLTGIEAIPTHWGGLEAKPLSLDRILSDEYVENLNRISVPGCVGTPNGFVFDGVFLAQAEDDVIDISTFYPNDVLQAAWETQRTLRDNAFAEFLEYSPWDTTPVDFYWEFGPVAESQLQWLKVDIACICEHLGMDRRPDFAAMEKFLNGFPVPHALHPIMGPDRTMSPAGEKKRPSWVKAWFDGSMDTTTRRREAERRKMNYSTVELREITGSRREHMADDVPVAGMYYEMTSTQKSCSQPPASWYRLSCDHIMPNGQWVPPTENQEGRPRNARYDIANPTLAQLYLRGRQTQMKVRFKDIDPDKVWQMIPGGTGPAANGILLLDATLTSLKRRLWLSGTRRIARSGSS
jgi:hypothetical protein